MSSIRNFFYQGSIPVTKLFLALTGVFFIVSQLVFLSFPNWMESLVLIPAWLTTKVWTLLTYALVNPGILMVLSMGLWLWFIGGSLELTWGSRRYLTYVVLVTIVSGLTMCLAAYALGIQGQLLVFGWSLPLTAVTWAWASYFPDRDLLIWGVIPVRAKWIAWAEAAIVFFTYLPTHILVALASLSGILVFYFFRGRGYRGSKSSGFSFKDWREQRRQKARRKKFRVIH